MFRSPTRNSNPQNNTHHSDMEQRIIQTLREEMSSMREELKACINEREDRINGLEDELTSVKMDVTALHAELDQAKKLNLILKNKIDATEAYERKDTVILSGGLPQYFPEENTSNVVLDLLHRKFPNVPCEAADISVTHRVPSKRKEGGRPKTMNIYVKLVRRDLKKKLVTASREQPKARSQDKIFVNESLTPQRSAVFHALRDIKKKNPNLIKGVTTIEGAVHCFTPREAERAQAAASPTDTAPNSRRPRNDRRHVINSREDLQAFCDAFIKKPLEDFITTWPNL